MLRTKVDASLHTAVKAISLDAVKRGDEVVVLDIPDGDIRAQMLRFGLHPGAEVFCLYRAPGGPVVIGCGNQEVAIGRSLARCITVSVKRSR